MLIAVIAKNHESGLQWFRLGHDIKEMNGRNLTITDGTKFVLVYFSDHLKGLEFDDILVAPGAGANPDYHNIYSECLNSLRR